MKKILLTLMLMFSLGSIAGELPTSIKLEKGNHFAITSQFNQRLLDNFVEAVSNYEKSEMYIYFDTPGGSVIALSQMARIMRNSDIKFTCVASFAASAGFMLFEHCSTRLLLPEGILMSHNWSGGFQGEAPRILTLFHTIQGVVDTLEEVVINKMSLDAKEYDALINKNLWMTAKLAAKYAAIDGTIGKVSCSKELIKQRLAYVARSFFGSSIVYKSGCPLVQKTYSKKSNKTQDEFIENEVTLFEMAQRDYKLGNANLIYLGSKNSFE